MDEWWNVKVIQQLFLEKDAKLILSISVSQWIMMMFSFGTIGRWRIFSQKWVQVALKPKGFPKLSNMKVLEKPWKFA